MQDGSTNPVVNVAVVDVGAAPLGSYGIACLSPMVVGQGAWSCSGAAVVDSRSVNGGTGLETCKLVILSGAQIGEEAFVENVDLVSNVKFGSIAGLV